MLTKSAVEEQRDITVQFIEKNTDVECASATLASHLLYLIQERGGITSVELKQALRVFYKKNGRLLLSISDYPDLAEIYMKHFSRNISKLGLAFFANRRDVP